MSSNVIKTKILQRRDTESNWNQVNPILSSGEIVFSETSGGIFMKYGDGRNYNDTPFWQTTSIDERLVSAFNVVHISEEDYEQLVISGTVDENTLYIMSSDNINAFGGRVVNVDDAVDLSDAVNLKQLNEAISGSTSALTAYATHDEISALSDVYQPKGDYLSQESVINPMDATVSGYAADALYTKQAVFGRAQTDSIANEFSTTATYEVDDVVMYEGVRYRCVEAVTTAGEWDSSDWTPETVQAAIMAGGGSGGNVAHKVNGATAGHLASLTTAGDLADSGVTSADFATAAQGAKADTALQQVSSATEGHFASFDSNGGLADSGKGVADFMDANAKVKRIWADSEKSTADAVGALRTSSVTDSTWHNTSSNRSYVWWYHDETNDVYYWYDTDSIG